MILRAVREQMTLRDRVTGRIRGIGRPLETYNPRMLGLVALIVLIALVVAALGVNQIGVGERSYQLEFAQAAGLKAGDEVTVAGVPVGTVDDLELAGDKVIATMRVKEDVSLGSESRAAIKLTTLLGARYVELQPAGGGELGDDRIDLGHTAVPYDLQQALENATTTFEQVDPEKIGTSLDTLAGELEGVPSVLPGVLDNIRSLSGILGDRRGELGQLLTGVRELTEVVNSKRGDIAAMVTVGRDVVQDIVARRAVIEHLMGATTRLVEQIGGVIGNNRPQMDALIGDLRGFLGSLARHDDLLRNTLEVLPVPIRNLANASGTGNDVDFTAPSGMLVDSWMCALGARGEQVNLPPYFEDCE